MRALLRVRTGDQVSLTYTSSYDFATTKDDVARYMVRVNSTSITRGELLWREALEQVTPIPGYDLAGTIRA
jgi:NADPH:quinone reductase-like Zn-dependent oxidoreductase